MDWNEDIIKNITDQKITDDEFAGKLIAELGDVVLNDAESLKKRFDAAATEVITPKHNELAEATQAAVTELRGAVDELETGEGGVTELKLDLNNETKARTEAIAEAEKRAAEAYATKAELALEGQARVAAVTAVDVRTANLYAPKGHTHEEYAAKEHAHEEYAATGHTHEEYAAKEHTHEEYAATVHTHKAADIEDLPTGGGMTLLWSGTLSSGNITIPDFQKYTLFGVEVGQVIIICQKTWVSMFGYFSGIGAIVAGTSIQKALLYGTYSSGSDTVNIQRIERWTESSPPDFTVSNHTTTGNSVTEIYGIA